MPWPWNIQLFIRSLLFNNSALHPHTDSRRAGLFAKPSGLRHGKKPWKGVGEKDDGRPGCAEAGKRQTLSMWRESMEKGYVQVYTGDGKGKTTAALGLALRAAGAGLSVYIAQFLKKGDYSELKALERFSDQITIEQFGAGGYIVGDPKPEDLAAGQKALTAIRAALKSGAYDIVIMEEAGVAEKFNIISADDILEIIAARPENVELVITGRGVSAKVMDAADLVTEMKEIRHYYQKGVLARPGIEN